MSANWQTILNQLLAKIERNSKSTLDEIKAIFERSNLSFDEKFRKNFLDISNNRVSEAYERFEIDALSVNHCVVNEASSTSNVDTWPKKHKSEDQPDSNSRDDLKKQKPKLDHHAGPIVDLTAEEMMYCCVHCSRKSASLELYDSTEEIHKHWTSYHPNEPFQFHICKIMKCYYCEKVGNYSKLRSHHKEVHSSTKPFGVVHKLNARKCGFCDFEADNLVTHFESVHKIISQLDVFNPICLSNETVEEMAKMHHKKLHKDNWMAKDNYDTKVLCPLCDKKMQNDEYMIHLRHHLFDLTCNECNYHSSHINEMVSHAKTAHGKERSADDFCSHFSDLLKKKYFETKVLFGNGLVLIKHNLLGTKWNDSLAFGAFINELTQIKKTEWIVAQEHHKLSLAELKSQNELINCIVVSGLPLQNDGGNLTVFRQYTEKLGMSVGANDIANISRLNDDRLVVKFQQSDMKEQILQAAADTSIVSGDLIELPPGVDSESIQIDNFMTDWYEEMHRMAKDAIKMKRIFCSWINEKGMAVKKSAKGAAVYILSKDELNDYINRDQ